MFHWVSFIEVILEFFPWMRSFGQERWGDTQFLKGREESTSVSLSALARVHGVAHVSADGVPGRVRLVEWPSALGGGRRRSISMALKTGCAAVSQAGGCIWSVTCNCELGGDTRSHTQTWSLILKPVCYVFLLFLVSSICGLVWFFLKHWKYLRPVKIILTVLARRPV